MENLKQYVKFDSSGDVDVDATMGELRTAVEAYATLQKADLESVKNAVHAVFDQYKGSNINLPALTNFAISHLKVTPSEHKVVSERIANYVRNNKAEFEINRGKGGGVKRVADQAPAVAAAE